MTSGPGAIVPLVSAGQLAGTLAGHRLCDLRWDLEDPAKGRNDYLEGHIPGAVFVDLDTDLAAPPGKAGRHPLPDMVSFAETLGRLGITPLTSVVAYDDSGGRIAARLWWMLRSIGHEHVAVLDGGLAAWRAAGGQLESGEVLYEPTSYPVPGHFLGTVEMDDLADRALVDARAPERYRGEVEPVDPRAGHIPGAVNIPTADNLTAGELFRSPSELAELYRELPPRPVMSCGSGVTACHNALAMVVAGHEMPDVYVGSFSEWSRSDRPVATGDSP